MSAVSHGDLVLGVSIGYLYTIGTFAGNYQLVTQRPIGNFASTTEQMPRYVWLRP